MTPLCNWMEQRFGKYIFKRLLASIPTLWLVSFFAFVFIELSPGDWIDQEIMKFSAASRSGYINLEQERKLLEKKMDRHIPPFYIELKSFSEPNLPDNIGSRFKRVGRKISQHYGPPDSVRAYICALNQLENYLLLDTSQQRLTMLNSIELFTNKQDIRHYDSIFESIKNFAYDQETRLNVIRLENIWQSFQLITWQKYLPKITLNFFQNRYHIWINNFISGNWGESYYDMQPVALKLKQGLTNTLWVTLPAVIWLFLIAVPLGIIQATTKNKLQKSSVQNVLYILDAIPIFWIAYVLIILLASVYYFNVFPAFGLGAKLESSSFFTNIISRLHHITLPIVCLVLVGLPFVSNHVQNAVEECFSSYYLIAAKAKGLSKFLVIKRHVIRNILIPILALFGQYLPVVFGGVFIIEEIFAIPGIGKLLISSFFTKDYPVIMSIVLCLAIVRIITNLLLDILYYFLEPKIRF